MTPAFYDEADLSCILGALKKLQRVLGDFNDAQVQETRLLDCGRALGAAGGPPGALLALGRLAEQTCQRRDRLRGQVVDTLARFRARTTRSACRRAFKEAGPGRTCAMRAVAIYNMKGGVGKTTTAVNLSYLAAAAGQRVLLWDLDPQAASSFAFRVQPRVAGFSKKSLESGEELCAAIKQTDYDNLDLLPADFAYRKLDRILDDIGKPERVVPALLDRLGRDYDVVFLDCPAGFSLLTEGVLAAADVMLVPTIPTVLSLRTIVRLIKCANRCDSPVELAAFFSMVDRRKVLHRRACEWSVAHHELFLSGQIPYASVVEQMAVRRLPLARLCRARLGDDRVRPDLDGAPGASSTARTTARSSAGSLGPHAAGRRVADRRARGDGRAGGPASRQSPAAAMSASRDDNACVVHRFDTEQRDLQRGGRVLAVARASGPHVRRGCAIGQRRPRQPDEGTSPD